MKNILLLVALLSFNYSFSQAFLEFELFETGNANEQALVLNKLNCPNNSFYIVREIYHDSSEEYYHILANNGNNDTLYLTYNVLSVFMVGLYSEFGEEVSLVGFSKYDPDDVQPFLNGNAESKLEGYTQPVSSEDNSEVLISVNTNLNYMAHGQHFINSNGENDSHIYQTSEYLIDGNTYIFPEVEEGFNRLDVVYGDFMIYTVLGLGINTYTDFTSNTSYNCPIVTTPATDVTTCNAEAEVLFLAELHPDLTYKWGDSEEFTDEFGITDLCPGNHNVFLKFNDSTYRNCAFSVGSYDYGYFNDSDDYDTMVYISSEYCYEQFDSVEVIVYEIISDSSFSLSFDFYFEGNLVDNYIDTAYLPLGEYVDIEILGVSLTLYCEDSEGRSNNSPVMVRTVIHHPFGGFLSLKNNGLIDNEAVSLYPNPTNGMITVKGVDNPELLIYDAKGKLVIKSKGNTSDLSVLTSGIYMAKIYDGGKLVAQKKLVLN